MILDPVGAGYLKANLRSLRTDGRLVIIGLMGGAVAELELGLMMMKRLRVIGSTLRARSIAAKSAVMDDLERVVWPQIEDGSDQADRRRGDADRRSGSARTRSSRRIRRSAKS